MRTLIAYDSFFGNTEIDTTYQITQHIRFDYALPFGTLLPMVATSYMLRMLSESI